MANNPDLARLRELTMGSTADEEAVTVNTRALIDKVLARYSGDWTTMRELIQNAADAAAKNVVIRFETLPSKTVAVPSSGDDSDMLKHTLLHHTVYRLVVSNDGQPFAESDWTRLKRIAEGNPDETKIGAFGVGFYSVFADCEEPFVISGRKTMAFIWKGNSLFTKTGSLGPEQSNQDTCFLLNYRSTTSPIPDLMSLCQFLSTSLTFVGLESIQLHLDNWNILTLTKKSAPGAGAQLPKGINTRTKEGLMQIVGVIHQSTQIDAKWINAVGWSPTKGQLALPVHEDAESLGPSLRSFFSRLKVGATTSTVTAKRAAREAEMQQQAMIAEDVCGKSQATVFLRISTVNIQTSVSSSFARELERATKKPPPKQTRIAILTSSHDETTASLSTVSGLTSEKAADIFISVLPKKHGRIFIGFPTAQTTGLLCHISAPSVIPTVERESIDLNARYVKTWNIEMLRVAGIACRIAYIGEMEELRSRLKASAKSGNRATLGTADIESVTPQAVHVFKQYTALESTPSSQVGRLIEEAFWDSSIVSSIDVLSTKGVLPSHKVRVVSEPLSFLENIPLIPEALSTGAEDFVRRLYDRGLVTDMTIKDIRKELESRSLDETQLVEFLKWCAAQLGAGQLDAGMVQGFLSSAVATIVDGNAIAVKNSAENSSGGKVLVLSEIKTFLLGSKIPPDLPLPPHTIPFKFTKGITRQQLESFGWDELQIVPWFRFLVENATSLPPDQCLIKAPAFASQALAVLSKSWDSMSQASKNAMVELLSPRTMIPTKLGMRRPIEAYFPSVKLFDDLPVITLHTNIKDKVLTALGVRKTIELTVVFDRLMAQSPLGDQKWSFTDLVHYLVSVKDDIPKQDIERLKSTAICPIEEVMGTERRAGRLYKVSELFEPKDIFRELGLPLLHWPGVFRAAGPECRFLTTLGLKTQPEVPQLVAIMKRAAVAGASNPQLYATALKYFVDYHHIHGYSRFDLNQIREEKFLPVEGHAFPSLAAPSGCYSNERGSIMGYPILAATFRPHAMKFGVASDPPIQQVATRVINNPPKSLHEAIGMFGYLAGRLGEINGQLAEAFGSAKIVPISVLRSEKRITRYVAPKMCFLGDPEIYGDILDFVDFGMEANSFLLKVGSKHEPSSPELARMVVDGPTKILGMLGDARYIDLLRKLAENQSSLKGDRQLWKDLKQSPCLLAYKEQSEVEAKGKENLDEYPLDEDETTLRTYSLRKASDIIIVDAIRDYMMFRDYISAAPQDDTLEKFYQSLGVPLLTSLIEPDHRIGNPRRDQSEAQKYQKLIVERSRLFLYEYSQDIRHDSKWLDKHLTVKQVDSISLSSTLKGYNVPPYREKRSASLRLEGKQEYTLYVTREPDLYEISTWTVRLLLNRPKQHDTLALEMVLGSDLRKLRTKGYNVDRILKQKAYENRVAEEEQKKRSAEEAKRRDEEQKRVAEYNKDSTKSLPPPPPYEAAAGTPTRGRDVKPPGAYQDSPPPSMPGAFGSDSPDDRALAPLPPPKGGLNMPWNSIQNTLQQWTQGLGGLAGPSGQRPGNMGGGSSSHGGSNSHGNELIGAHDVDPVQSERNIAQNLSSAVQACRSHTSSNIFSEPRTTQVEEAQGSYCDNTPGQDISLATTSASGIKVFLSNKMSERNSFLVAESIGIEIFCYLLLELSSLFNLSSQSIHIFYDNAGRTIAFNQDGALFFNYHYFKTLHKDRWDSSRGMKIEALAYWWITLCHELAHNLVKEHSARHSFYAESFAQQYFGRVMAKAMQFN